ncbi:MAG: SDR family oxidoreductase [Bacteroidales bacterium]|jgi:gluconate 5-dehydrogenase|nr:SDR family oxidoreductase [Bacteroidales bacterium]
MNVLDSFSLKNKIAIITGGYGHLGRAMSEALNEAGATVVVAGRSKEKFDSIFTGKSNYHFAEIDIADTKSIQNCFKKVENEFGAINVLLNNACYVASGGKIPEEITDKEWQASVAGVLGSVFKCIREIVPIMKAGGGSIINISSMYGIVSPDFSIYEGGCSSFFNPADYGASKAGVIQLTKYFATYLIKNNINVNCISPGTFPSPTVQKNFDFVNHLTKKNPAHRIGNPEDLKGAVVFLASEASKYIVGQNIIVDGGWTIW